MASLIAVAAVLCGVFLTLAVAMLAVGEYLLVTRLRRDYPPTWKLLGSPSPWFTRWQDLSAVSKFLGAREYDHLSDPQVKSLGNKLRILTKVVFALVATTLLLIVLARISAKYR